MKSLSYLAVVIAGALFLGLFPVVNALAQDYADTEPYLSYMPDHGYSVPAKGGDFTEYYYDAYGRTHLVQVDPFTMEVTPSPVDPDNVHISRGVGSR